MRTYCSTLGVENSQHYDNAQIEFMGIANIHKMRESWDALKALVSPSSVEDGDKHYHNRLESKSLRWSLLCWQSGF